MSTGEARSHSWQINGLRIEGLGWGDPNAQPLLCLHGWLDNAASFSLLGPLLNDFHVVALDLTGHGRSSRRSADAGYQIWDDLPEIQGVVDELGWDEFNLLGHSRGAIISTLFAATLPQRVRRLVLLDAVMPQPLAQNEFPGQMAHFLRDKGRLLGRKTRVFDTIEAAVQNRADAGLPQDAARLLTARNLRPCDGGYTWSTDPRLRGASAVKLSEGQIDAVLSALCMPTLLLLAEQGFGRQAEMSGRASQYIRQLEVCEVTGGHHFHMEPGAAIVAQQITGFLLGTDSRESNDK